MGLGGSSFLLSIPWHYGEAPFPSYNASPKAAPALLKLHEVPRGAASLLGLRHANPGCALGIPLAGFGHPHLICLEVEGRWVDASTDHSVPNLARKLFLGPFKGRSRSK